MLSLAVAGFAAIIGFDRERAFYPTVLIVIVSCYVLFAAMGGSGHTLAMESVVGGRFLVFAVIGFKTNFWLIVAALIGHAIFDFVHRFLIDNPGVPHWWPGFCLTCDASLGVFLAVRRIRHPGARVNHDRNAGLSGARWHLKTELCRISARRSKNRSVFVPKKPKFQCLKVSRFRRARQGLCWESSDSRRNVSCPRLQ